MVVVGKQSCSQSPVSLALTTPGLSNETILEPLKGLASSIIADWGPLSLIDACAKLIVKYPEYHFCV